MPVSPLAEESPRVRAVRAGWPSWLRLPAAWILALVVLLALGGGLYWALKAREPFPRPRVDAPPKPQLDVAIAAAQQKLRDDPQDLEALVTLGTLSFEKGKASYPDAVNYLEEARELGALDARIFYCLGVMYQELGLYPFAVAEYRRFLRNHASDKDVRMRLAKLLYQLGRFDEAVSEYERLRYHHPSDRIVEENLGLSLWAAKNIDRAAEAFGVLRGAGGAVGRRAEFYMGQISNERGQHEAAVAALTTALQGQGELGVPLEQVHAALGLAYQKLGRDAEAKAAWEEVLKLVPKDPKAQAALRQLSRKAPRQGKKR